VPDTRVPDARVPDTQMPDAWAPDAQIPDARVPDAQMPDTRALDAQILDARVPDAQMPDARAPDAQIPDAQTPGTKRQILDTRRQAPDTSVIPDFFIDPLVLSLTEAPPNITAPQYFTRSSSKRYREDDTEANERLTKIARVIIT
jgi:hypothetical protein